MIEHSTSQPRYNSRQHIVLPIIAWDPARPAEWVNDHIVMAHATSNAYAILGDEGDVIINSGTLSQGPRIREKFEQLIGRPLKVARLIFTQSHPDHVGGWQSFADEGVVIHGQRMFSQIHGERTMLGAFFGPRNARVIPSMIPAGSSAISWSDAPEPAPLTTFADELEFACSGRTIRLLSLHSGETLDSLGVYIPDERTVFTGNWAGAIHKALPNFTTARGDRQRSVPGWLKQCDMLLGLKPELLITGHEQPIVGNAQIAADLGKVRAAVALIHDHTVAGMVAGTPQHTILATLALPAELEPRAGRSPHHWIARSVWEEYAGWFRQERTSEVYPTPQSAVWAELVELAGGAGRLAERARAHLPGEPEKALHLIEIAAEVEPGNKAVRQVEAEVYLALIEATGGIPFDLLGWLEGKLAEARAAIGEAG